MLNRRAVSAAVACLVLVSAGCQEAARRRSGAAEAQGSLGPRAALVRWHHALADGDKETYLASFVGTEDELVLCLAVFDVVQAGYAFRDAVLARHGDAGWRAIQQSDATRVGLFPRDPAWPMQITLVRADRLAFGYVPGGTVPLHLSETGGRWILHAAALVPPGHTAERAAYYLFRWAAAIRELADRVKEPGRFEPDAARDAFHKRLDATDYSAAETAVHAFDSFLH